MSMPVSLTQRLRLKQAAVDMCRRGNDMRQSRMQHANYAMGDEMTRVLFVHGTGVRSKNFNAVFDKVVKGIAEIRPNIVVEPCLWGDHAGARLLADGLSVPTMGMQRPGTYTPPIIMSPSTETETETEIREDSAVWFALELDPLFELSELSAAKGRIHSSDPTEIGDYRTIFQNAVINDARVKTALSAAGLHEVASAALDILFEQPEFKGTINNEWVEDSPKISAVARAVVALSMKELDRRLGGEAAIDGQHRDQVVAALVEAVGGDSRGLGSGLLRGTLNILLRLGALSTVERNRSSLTSAMAPAAGDVLQYLVRGHKIRNYIREAIICSSEEVVVVGHSLGAIAALDLLVGERLSQVTGLVSVGTQAGLLYELNALPGLAFGEQLPPHFPTWDNILDIRDLLAYSAQSVFPDSVVDHLLDNRTPFPRNHGAYFGNRKFYSLLNDLLP